MNYNEELFIILVERSNFCKDNNEEEVEMFFFSILDMLEEGLFAPEELIRVKRALKKCLKCLQSKGIDTDREYSKLNLKEILK